jgi:hypothetical protein
MRNGRRVAQIRVSVGQQYRFELPAGRYTLLLGVPPGDGSCPVTVLVAAGETVHANIICVFHG